MKSVHFNLSPDLEQLTDQIVRAANPERVVLFGSRAKGTFSPSSDCDIALVFKDRDQVRKGIREANRALWPRRFPIDLVGLTSETLRTGRTALAREVARAGRPLYRKHAS